MDIEKIRSSILAYCEEVCPKEGDQWRDESTGLRIRCAMTNSNWKESKVIWIANAHGASVSVSPREKDNTAFVYLYRLLGLETRDALADYKSENERLQSAWMTEKARNTALVAALESLKIRAWDAFNKIELAAVQKGAVGRIKRQHTPADTKENEAYIGEILDAKHAFDAQVDELIAEKGGANEN